MKILLINPLMSEPTTFFPLGLGYIAQVLIDDGHHVSVLDINAHRWSDDEVKRQIISSDFDIVGISALITQYSYVKWLTKVIKEFNPLSNIIIGGGLVSSIPEIILRKTHCDIAVIGEGEFTIKELVDVLEDSKNLNNVRGIAFKENNKISRTELRRPIENLDDIPFPARNLFPMEKYIGPLFEYPDSSIRATNMITSRGCPFSCVYCDKGIFGQKFRARSPDNIIEEIEYLIKEYKINGISFNDDTFVLNKKRVHFFCDQLNKNDINIHWACNGRVNLMDEHLFKKMEKTGCRAIAYGIESGNQKILDALNKKTTVEQGESAIQLTWKTGMVPHAYLMIGMFGENERTIQDTINFCRKLGVGHNISFVTPFPGTPLYKKVKEINMMDTEEDLLENDKFTSLNTKFVVNLSDMPDKRLMDLKEYADRKVQRMSLTRIRKLYKIIGGKELVKVPFSNILMMHKKEGGKNLIRKGIKYAKRQLLI